MGSEYYDICSTPPRDVVELRVFRLGMGFLFYAPILFQLHSVFGDIGRKRVQSRSNAQRRADLMSVKVARTVFSRISLL